MECANVAVSALAGKIQLAILESASVYLAVSLNLAVGALRHDGERAVPRGIHVAVHTRGPNRPVPLAVDRLVENLAFILDARIEHVVYGKQGGRGSRPFFFELLRAQYLRVLRPVLDGVGNDEVARVVLHGPGIVVVPRRAYKQAILAWVDDVGHDFENALLHHFAVCAGEPVLDGDDVVAKDAVVMSARRHLVNAVGIDGAFLRDGALEIVCDGAERGAQLCRRLAVKVGKKGLDGRVPHVCLDCFEGGRGFRPRFANQGYTVGGVEKEIVDNSHFGHGGCLVGATVGHERKMLAARGVPDHLAPVGM